MAFILVLLVKPEGLLSEGATMSNALSRAVERYGAFRDEWYALPALVAASLILLAAMPFLRQLARAVRVRPARLAQPEHAHHYPHLGDDRSGVEHHVGVHRTVLVRARRVLRTRRVRDDHPDRNLRDLPVDRDAARQRPRGDIRAVDRRVDLPLRSGGHYFALATLAFAELLRYVFTNVPQLGGASGFFRPLAREYADGPGLAAFQFTGDLPYYYLILGFLTVVTVVVSLNRSTGRSSATTCSRSASGSRLRPPSGSRPTGTSCWRSP